LGWFRRRTRIDPEWFAEAYLRFSGNDLKGDDLTDDTIPLEIDVDAVRREEARKSRTYEAIGAFVFHFSQLEFTIRVLLSGILGLTEEQIDVVTAPYDFRMLCTVTKIILIQRLSVQKKQIEDLFGRCLSLNDRRVQVAHGLWSDDGKGLTARHVARGSLRAEYFFENTEDLVKLADTAQRLMAEILFVMNIPTEGPQPIPSIST